MAIDKIEANEPMLEIPIKLMMSPLHAFNDPIIGECLKKNQDLLKGIII